MKPIIVFSVIGCVCLLAGILPSPKNTAILFEHTAYYFIFAAFFLWVFCLLKVYLAKLKQAILNHYGGLLVSVLLIILIFGIAPPKFKVLADETNLVGISMSLYQSKKASLPVRGFNTDYRKPEYTSQVDKRPIFYPFLVSLVHALRGYSVYNGFIVNFICAILSLLMFYLLVDAHFPRLYAYLSILIVAGLPNFVIWVTSGGFETLNLFFIVFALYQFDKVISTESSEHAELLFLSLVLLAQCRYESVIYAMIALVLLPLLFTRKTLSRLTIVTYLVPLLFLPVIWLPRLWALRPIIDKMAAGSVQVPSLIGAFGFSNLISNTPANLIVFSGLEPHFGFSPLISVMALAGAYLIIRKRLVARQGTSLVFRNMLLFGGITFALLYLIQSSFYLGDMTLATQNRFALAFVPYIVLPAIYFIHAIFHRPNVSYRILAWIFFGFHLVYFWPYGAQQLLVNHSTVPYEYNKTLNYLKHNYDRHTKILIICERPYYYIVAFSGALDFDYANRNAEMLLNKVGREFDHIIVLQKHLYKTGQPLPGQSLNPSYRLSELQTINLTQTEYLQISKLMPAL